MTAITIVNRRIEPYSQKNNIKAIFGDTMVLSFRITGHAAGDDYILGLDYERVVYPTVRPVCGLSSDYSIDGDVITFTLELNTERFAKWVSTLKKPTPVWLQLCRIRGDVSDTLLLDDVLAIPSIIDGENTIFPGDPISELLAAKLDAPEAEGSAGQILKLGADGETVWANGGGGGGSVDWSDIEGKPDFATVATTGDYNDLSNTPTLAAVASTGSYADLIDKPTFAAVATTGDYQDLSNKPTIPTDYIPTSAKGSANGVATLDASGYVPDAELRQDQAIITIPPATSVYTLYDGIYKHAPASTPTYTLPNVSDASRTHTVILTVSFANVLSLSFQTEAGSTIAPLDTLTISSGDIAEYLCRYDALQSAWVIAAGKMNA